MSSVFSLHVWVGGEPKPQPRARASVVGSKRVRIWTPSSADDFKGEVRAQTRLALHHRPVPPHLISGVFSVDMLFLMPRPRSHYRSGRNARMLAKDAPAFPAGKPDLDNVVKAVLDALTKFQGLPSLLWADDAQVVSLTARKVYAAQPAEAGLRLFVEGRER